MEWTKDKIFRRELERAIEEGYDDGAANVIASQRTEQIYDEMIDKCRQQAKDHELY